MAGQNNPGNIRLTSIPWVGMCSLQKGPYVDFISPEYGFRAMAKILASYQKEGIHTIRAAISRWAPEADGNPTEQYIQNVSDWTGIDPDVTTALPELPILRAMTRQEQGRCDYPDSTIALGLTLANPQAET
jgi:hypothetical protein